MNSPQTHNPQNVAVPGRSRTRVWTTVLLAAVIFVAGAAVGGGATVLVALRRLEYAMHHPQVVPQRLTDRLTRRLDLTPDQAARVKAIIIERQAAFEAIRLEMYPRVTAQLDQARDEIDEVLTDEQREQWQAWFDKTRRRFRPPPPHLSPQSP
jgi:Spy/CpxP family protein refolding chaperone